MSIETYQNHRGLTHGLSVFLVVLMLFSCCSICTMDAQAIALADDVVLALLAGALAAIGVTASAPTMAQLGTGLTDLVDEWEIGQGIMSGTMFGIIANSAIALGAGAFQLGNNAWEKIQGFVDWLKVDKGLSFENPINSTAKQTVELNGNSYAVNQNLTNVEVSQTAIYISEPLQYYDTISIGDNYGPYSFLKKSNYAIGIYTGDGASHVSVGAYGSIGNISTWNVATVLYGGYLYFVAQKRQTQPPYDYFTTDVQWQGWNLDTTRYQYYGAISNTGDYELKQNYTDDAEPLPYVQDQPLNVYIPGSTAGTLEQVANDISISVETDTLEAEAVQTYPEGGNSELPNIVIPSSGFFSSIWHYVVQAMQDAAEGIAFLFNLVYMVVPPAILNLAWASVVLVIIFGILNKFLE